MTRVVDRLEHAVAPGITIVEIHHVGYGYEPNYFETRFEDVFKRYQHLEVVKLEVVCADRDLDRFVQLIQEECRTGTPGDGMIFVSEVSAAIRIRDGASGEVAL